MAFILTNRDFDLRVSRSLLIVGAGAVRWNSPIFHSLRNDGCEMLPRFFPEDPEISEEVGVCWLKEKSNFTPCAPETLSPRWECSQIVIAEESQKPVAERALLLDAAVSGEQPETVPFAWIRQHR
jgi:hypothetical protein